jgi:methane monooxygenase regulatory protein B
MVPRDEVVPIGLDGELDPEALRRKMWSSEGVKETRRVVVVLIRCDEIETVVEWLEERYGGDPGFRIDNRGPYYRIDCLEGLEVDLDEIEPLIGHSYNVFDFLVSVSTAVGRTMTVGNRFIATTSLLGLEEEVPSG